MASTRLDVSRLPWRTAKKNGNSGCVEVAPAHLIAVRDSKDRNGAVLLYTPQEWEAFLDGVKKGEFDDLVR